MKLLQCYYHCYNIFVHVDAYKYNHYILRLQFPQYTNR